MKIYLKTIAQVWLIFLLGVLSILTACNQNGTVKKETAKVSTAHFDYFNYQGKDDFYNDNPLSTPNSYYNPILPGFYPDPSICTNGEDYFMVTSTFVYFPGVPIFHSRDLINWKQIGNVLNRPTQMINLEGQHTSGGIFAPAISYNPHNKTYYLITTNVGAGNFYVKTTDPFSSWSDPIWLPEVHGIDPSFFFDDDGRTYILNNDEPEGGSTYDGHRAIRIREFDIENEKVIGPDKVLVNGGVHFDKKPIWIEGPHMYKINGQYLLMAAEGGTGPVHSEVIFRGNRPMGDFIAYKNNPILTQRHLSSERVNPVTCVGHADLVMDKLGSWWSVFLACRPINGKYENLGRETFLMPVRWTNDGFPFLTSDNDLVPLVGHKTGTIRNRDVLFGNFTCNDDFNSPKLGLEWLTLRSPANELYTLTAKEGSLSLKIADVSASETKVPAFVCRRIQHHKFECSTKLMLDTENESEKAGILLYKDEKHQYFFAVNAFNNSMTLSLQKISCDGIQLLAEEKLQKEQREVMLKVDSDGTGFNFCYAFDENKDNWKLLAENIDAYYLSTTNSFGFTGTTIGMYATKQ